MTTYVPITPYADVTFGDAYFAERLRTDAWDDATSGDKTKALCQATEAINKLNFAGDKADASQVNQFPRGGDTVVPQDIAKACCELALALLDDVDPNLEIENLVVAKEKIGDFGTERDASFVQEHIALGIPSIQAWALLQPFRRNPSILDIDRS